MNSLPVEYLDGGGRDIPSTEKKPQIVAIFDKSGGQYLNES